MNLEKMIILQQGELEMVGQLNYFNSNSPCHIYFVCKRPRITVDINSFSATDEELNFRFKIQRQDKADNLKVTFKNDIGTKEITLHSNYPYNSFELRDKANEKIMFAKVPVLLQDALGYLENSDFLDLEVLYIGQSYGVDGARTAPDRLKNHSTLQGIYSEAIANNPDCEIWLALASFEQINLMMFDGTSKFTKDERQIDKDRFQSVYTRLNFEGINEQQRINFTEAALIKYFQPPYNKIYKDSFPNPAHSTYSECYELDINSVCIELQTSELINCQFYSKTIKRAPWHMKDFLLKSPNDRKSMFEFEL